MRPPRSALASIGSTTRTRPPACDRHAEDTEQDAAGQRNAERSQRIERGLRRQSLAGCQPEQQTVQPVDAERHDGDDNSRNGADQNRQHDQVVSRARTRARDGVELQIEH